MDREGALVATAQQKSTTDMLKLKMIYMNFVHNWGIKTLQYTSKNNRSCRG